MGQTTFRGGIEGASEEAASSAAAEAATGDPAAPAASATVLEVPMKYEQQQCESGLSMFRGCQEEPRAGVIARLLAQEYPLYVIANFKKLEKPVPEDLASPEYLMSWLPKESREAYSPMILSASDGVDLFSLIEEAWGKDAVVSVCSRQERPKLLLNFRRNAGTFCRPDILRPQMNAAASEYVENLFSGIDAVLLEGDSPEQWTVFSRSEFNQTLEKLGFVRAPAEEN